LNRFFTWLFGPFLRETERTGLTGSAFMMAGVTLIVWLYPKNVVILTLILFAVADPLASYFGIRFGKDKLIGNKSFQGSAAAFVACFVASGAYFATHRLMTDRLFIVCLLSGLIGAISELVPIGKLDDNFVFPVLSATMLTGMFYVFGGL
jgi:dolichol kinase